MMKIMQDWRFLKTGLFPETDFQQKPQILFITYDVRFMRDTGL